MTDPLHEPASEDKDTDAKPSTRLWIVVSGSIVLLAICIRLLLNLRHTMAPGVDAAYYPMQTRWLVENGELQLSAMPLIFWIDALLAKVLMWLPGLEAENAVQLACRFGRWFLSTVDGNSHHVAWISVVWWSANCHSLLCGNGSSRGHVATHHEDGIGPSKKLVGSCVDGI